MSSTNRMPATTLTIHHTYEDGTTIEGEKNSPAHHAIKANRSWTWSRHAGAWLLRSSRHQRPKYRDINLIEQALTELGYTLTRKIDETMPTVEQQEDDRAERMDDRSERLAERAGKQASAAAESRAKADAVFDNLPFGQPILIGHHSEQADRNRRARARENLSKSVEQANHAAELSHRSETAAGHMEDRHHPVAVGNRIEKLQADRRAVQRRLDGAGSEVAEFWTDEGDLRGRSVHRPLSDEARAQWEADASELDQQIAYWNRVYAVLQAAGKVSTAGPDTVSKGDWVLVRGHWYRVRRVNKKTVSVPSPLTHLAPQPGEREHTDTSPWREVREHRTTEQMPPAFVDAYETPGTDRVWLAPAQFPDHNQSSAAAGTP